MSINRLPQLQEGCQNLMIGMADVLTPREYTIAALASAGLSNKEVARKLALTEGTIKVHLHNIFRKARVTNRTALAALMNGYTLR